MDYMEFELEIERVGERYRARVLEAPAGGRAQTFFDLPSGKSEWIYDDSVPRDAGTRHFTVESPAGDAAREMGRALFECILAGGEVGVRWQASRVEARSEGKGLRLRLRFSDDPELLAVPWELLYDPDGGFLSHAEETPVVRSLEVAGRRRRLTVEGPVRFLALLSCPPDASFLEVEREWGFLEQDLAPRVVREEASLEKLRSTLPELLGYLRTHECHVLHFVGHGVCGESGSALAFENSHGELRWVDQDKLAAFLGHRALRLVVLNACEGARPGHLDPLDGVAQSLVRRGVPAVVAMQRDVRDNVAIEFTRHFYHALAEGLPVDGAMSQARQEIFASFDGPAWAIPVLYMSARNGQIWSPVHIPTRSEELKNRWSRLSRLAKALLVGGGAALISGALFLSAQKSDTDDPPPPNHTECPSPPGLEMAFVRLDPGIFEMGESKGDKGDEPVHQVKISQPFCLSTFEVTQGQWDLVFGGSGTSPAERDLPVGRVTFEAAQDFIRRLNDQEASRPYRLPTEAEWEYAARARASTRYSFGDDPKLLPLYGNCKGGDPFDGPAPAGRFQPNDFGLYDMYGNVFEWVADWYGPYSKGPVTDPRGPVEGERRIRRGGSWDSGAQTCTSAARSHVEADRKDQYTGFRIVRVIR